MQHYEKTVRITVEGLTLPDILNPKSTNSKVKQGFFMIGSEDLDDNEFIAQSLELMAKEIRVSK